MHTKVDVILKMCSCNFSQTKAFFKKILSRNPNMFAAGIQIYCTWKSGINQA